MSDTPKILIEGGKEVFSVDLISYILMCFEEGFTKKEIAKDVGTTESRISNILIQLQKSGRCGTKKKGGYLPGAEFEWSREPNPEIPIKEIKMSIPKKKKAQLKEKEEKQETEKESPKQLGLADLLNDLNEETVQNQISTHHKELLIEVLHKLIC